MQPPISPALSGKSEAVRTRPPASITALAQAATSHPNQAKAVARYGSALVEAGEAQAGIAYLRRAVTLDPRLTAAWHNLALAAEGQSWLDIAAEAYARVTAAKPSLAGEWIKLGYVLLPLGRYEEAEHAFQRAAALQPENSEPLVALASTYYASFHYDLAIAALKRAAAINPHSAAAQANLASIQQELGKRAEAEAAVRAALTIAPGDARHWLMLGRILHDSPVESKRQEARSALEHALSLREENGAIPLGTSGKAEAAYLLGMLATNAGARDEAVAFWRRAYQYDPTEASALRMLGQEMVRQGGSQAAGGRALLQKYGQIMDSRGRERQLSQAAEMQPKDGATRLRYGKLLLSQGSLPHAVWELREAVRLRPQDSEARRTLAEALRRQGREAEAHAVTQEVTR